MSPDILSQYPKAEAFLSEEEALNISDNHALYAILERLLTRLEALESRRS